MFAICLQVFHLLWCTDTCFMAKLRLCNICISYCAVLYWAIGIMVTNSSLCQYRNIAATFYLRRRTYLFPSVALYDPSFLVTLNDAPNINLNSQLTEWDIVHSAAASCGTYLILKVFGSTGFSVIAIFVFNMVYLLYGKKFFVHKQSFIS